MDASERVAEIEEYLLFLHSEWPALKSAAEEELSPRCQRCILSAAATKLVDGLCPDCRADRRSPSAEEEGDAERLATMRQELHELLATSQGAGHRRHDALLLFSGGKDSAYLLHQLRTQFSRLRLLAVTIDNGLFSSVAMANAKHIVERISVDHMVYRPHGGLFRTTFRHAFTHLGQRGCYEVVDRMDGDLAFDIGRNLAASMEIPLMIAGLSPAQVERILGLNAFESPRERERSTRTESAGFQLRDIFNDQQMQSWWNGAAWPAERVPRVIYPFYAWRYDEQQVRKEVVRLGLIEPEKDNPLATNNDTIPLMLAVDVCRLGYSSFEWEFAELVRADKADRDAWLALFQSLEYLAKRGRFLPRCIEDTLTRLGLDYGELGLPEPELAACKN